MTAARWLQHARLGCVTLGCVTLTCATAMVGCAAREPVFFGVDTSSGLMIVLRPMPQGHSFTGKFRSPHLGELTLEQLGTALNGSYRYEADGRRVIGSLRGNVHANVAVVRWHEHAADASASAGVGGLGFFLYDVAAQDGACPPGQPRPARLFGRRQVATRIFPMLPDEQFTWLNVGERDEPWTAVEIVPGDHKP